MTETPATAHTLLEQLLAFRDQRDWKQFHTPKNLASALVVEASELLSIFQWTSDADLDEAAEKKMVLNAQHYPADRARGNATKYTEF